MSRRETRERFRNLSAVYQKFLVEQERIVNLREWKRSRAAWGTLRGAITGIPFDPRFNAIHWAADAELLCREIVYSICWMLAYAETYKQGSKKGERPSDVDFWVQYFSDNAASRIDSCRDKLALLAWSYYCAFNPEEGRVLDYGQVVERLTYPVKFGLKLSGQGQLVRYLALLQGSDFQRVERYRNLKIHKREPRIEIYGVEPHHDWSYMVPLTDPKEIAAWKAGLARQYPDPTHRRLV